jgi:integrase
LLSGLRTFSQVTGLPLGQIPTGTRELRLLMNTVSPALHNMTERRWGNVRSLVFKAVNLAEERCRADRQRHELSPQWAELLAPLPMKQVQIPLRPFARWCSAAGIEPHHVTQAVAGAYGHYLEEQSTRARPREAYCAMVRAWNKASELNDHWPPLKIVLDTQYDHYVLPWSTFPASFCDDVDAMIVDAMGVDLTASRTRRPIKAVTARNRRCLIRAFASGLVRAGRDPNSIERIADIVTIEAARAGLQFILDRLGGQTTVHVHQHAKLLCTLAKHWVGVPEDQLAELAALRARLKPQQHGMTAKNRDTLRYFEDPRFVEKFLRLPEAILRQYGREASRRQSAAVKVQIALAIEILIGAPVRVKNLHAIKVGENLIELGSGRNRRLHLYCPADEVKNAVELEFPLSAHAIRLLDLYMSEVRPLVLRASSPYLFPGAGEKPKGAALLSEQIANTVEEFIGVRLTAHQFRHLIGFIYLQENPGGHEVVRSLLGHKSIETTIQFYAGMETQRAIAHYDDYLSRRRAEVVRASARRGDRSPRRSAR